MFCSRGGGKTANLSDLMAEFDESLWAALVDSMTVYSKERIVFRMTCSMEIEV